MEACASIPKVRLCSDEWRCDSKWILLPFTDDAAAGSSITTAEEDQFIEMSKDSVKRHTYDTLPLVKFWRSCQPKFPELAAKAVKFFCVFFLPLCNYTQLGPEVVGH